MRESTCKWCIIENAKIFLSYAKKFLKSPASKKGGISIGQCKYIFINLPIAFFDWHNKTSQLLAFLRSFMKKVYKLIKSIQKSLQCLLY